MIELGRLYEEVADLINQQDVAVEQINQGAETVVDNVDKANTQIDSAIHHARNRRKWKWYLLAIIILIIVIVVGVAVGVVEANKKN
jgi:syntaxin 1B/2/3